MNKLLVSVVVICYNSGEYLLDTLNSIKKQTYSRIEVIISDDSSIDDTREISERWIANNQDCFEKLVYVSTPKNSGVTINIDLGTRAASGQWIKTLAGDDLLPERAIEECLEYIKINNINTVLCTKSERFREVNGEKIILGYAPDAYTINVFKNSDAKLQLKKMLREYIMPTSPIISKELLEDVGYYETDFPEVEDFPLWLKITKSGVRINICDEILGYSHRCCIDSTSQSKDSVMNASAFKINGKQHRQDKRFVLPEISYIHLVFYYHFYLDLLRRYVIIDILKNRKTLFNNLLNRIFLLLDPIFMRKKIYNWIHAKDS